MRARTLVLWVFLACVALAAGMGLLGLLGGQGVLLERLLVTAVIFGVACVPAMVQALVLERRGARGLAWFGSVATGAAAMLWLAITWDIVSFSLSGPNGLFEWTLRLAAMFTTLSVWSALMAPVVLVSFQRLLGRCVRVGALVCTSMTAILIMFAVFFEDTVRLIDDGFWRAMGVFAILGLAATFAVPALRRLEHADHDGLTEHTIARRPVVRVHCPRCDAAQTIRSGAPSSCDSCGLRIRVEVEEPRCTCGYLLYGVSGDVCPECGAEVRRWVAGVSDGASATGDDQRSAS